MTSLRFFLVTLGCEVFSVKRDSFGHPKRAQKKKSTRKRKNKEQTRNDIYQKTDLESFF